MAWSLIRQSTRHRPSRGRPIISRLMARFSLWRWITGRTDSPLVRFSSSFFFVCGTREYRVPECFLKCRRQKERLPPQLSPTFYPRPRLSKQTFPIRVQSAPRPSTRGCAPPPSSSRNLGLKMFPPPPQLSVVQSVLGNESEKSALLGNSI